MMCMVLHKPLPRCFLVAGHLYAVRWKRLAGATMGPDFSVDSPRNGILWNSAIQYVFEHQRICFSYSGPGGEFILHVLDKSLLPMKLASVGQRKNDPEFVKVLGDITFQALHNKAVDFTSSDGKGPFKGALALHAKVALEHSVKTYPTGFDPRQYNFDDKSEYEGKEEFLQVWLSKLDTGSVVEEGVNEEAAVSFDPETSTDEDEAGAEGV